MFPLNYNPKLPYCILVPPYDPLIEYYTNGPGAPSSGRTEYRLDRGGSQHRADLPWAACSRPDQPLNFCSADSDGGAMGDDAAAFHTKGPSDRRLLCAAGGPRGPDRLELDRRPV